ncbi:MAG: zf-C2H2 type zinc finger protein [Amphiamblys sp. WSBS2006]|nr:MAG: zf-C2H2 type zinc finger protein [Amphiamblys sp. WSBS2006]
MNSPQKRYGLTQTEKKELQMFRSKKIWTALRKIETEKKNAMLDVVYMLFPETKTIERGEDLFETEEETVVEDEVETEPEEPTSRESLTSIASKKKSTRKSFFCEECGAGFGRKHDLYRHERKHSNEFVFPCPHCENKFSRKDCLKRHLAKGICLKKKFFISNHDENGEMSL